MEVKPLGTETKKEPWGSNKNESRPEDNYVVSWRAVQAAAKEPTDSVAYKLAAMIFPQDGDTTKFDAKRAADGYPRATVVMKGENGEPRLRANDKQPDIRFLCENPPDCRFCAVTAADPRHKIFTEGWGKATRGGHNPFRCGRSIAFLMTKGAAGAELLWEKPGSYARK